MTRKILLRCFIVSFIAAVAVIPATVISLMPNEDELVIDLRAIDPDKLFQLSEEEQNEFLAAPPLRRVRGIERLTYGFSHPQWSMFLWPQITTWFLFFLASTVSVSYWNAKEKSDT